MTTHRLFDQDPYLKSFNAQVTGQQEIDGRFHVVLDQSAFYPESGGQPGDHGTLNGEPVIQLYEQDEKIVHVLRKEIQNPVTGEVDWQIRFDHMQQHTGQHILSRVVDALIQGKTIGFHLGESLSTIDIDKAGLSDESIKTIEDQANAVVFKNLPVKTHLVSSEEAEKLPLRKDPVAKEELRIVEVNGFDWSACCGTHCRYAGEIGLIKILKYEKYKSGTRITFVCGTRALSDYQTKTHVLKAICQPLSVSEEDLPAKLSAWQKDRKTQSKKIKELLNELFDYRADVHYQSAKKIDSVRYVELKNTDYTMDELRLLVQKLTQKQRCLILAGTNASPQSFIFARSNDVDINLQTCISPHFDSLGLRGGGRPDWVQAVQQDDVNADKIINRTNELIFSSRP